MDDWLVDYLDEDDWTPLFVVHVVGRASRLSAAEIAYVLGNDPEFVMEAIEIAQEAESRASAAALEARSNADGECVALKLEDARYWAIDAQDLASAMDYLNENRLPLVPFKLSRDFEAVCQRALEWLFPHVSCEREWNETDQCPVHGLAIRAGRARESEAVANLYRLIRDQTRTVCPL